MFPYRRVCTIQSAAAVVWGLILLVFPAFVVGLLGAETDPGGLVVGRFGGGMLFALGGTLSALRDQTDLEVRKRVALANATCDLAVAAVLAHAFYTGVTGGLVGGMVVFFFGFNTVSWLGTTLDTGSQPSPA